MTDASHTSRSALRVDGRQKRRLFLDRLARVVVGMGGSAVIVAIGLIFVYLLWVVAPLFKPATIELADRYALPAPAAGATLLLGLQDEGERAYRLAHDGTLVFFDPHSGAVTEQMDVTAGAGVRAAVRMAGGRIALLTGDGHLQLVAPQFSVSFQGERRSVKASVGYPLGEAPVAVEGLDSNADALDVGWHDSTLTLVAHAGNRLQVVRYEGVEEGYPVEYPAASGTIEGVAAGQRFWLGARGESLFVIGRDGVASVYDLADAGAPSLQSRTPLVAGTRLTAVTGLLGGYSLLAGDDRGTVAQWTALRQGGVLRLVRIREFDYGAPIQALLPETGRKGFLAFDARGVLHVAHTTSERNLAQFEFGAAPPRMATIDKRGDSALIEANAGSSGQGGLVHLAIENPHPEVSWHALWEKVWYEGYEAPTFSWQSSSADDDFEPKLSLAPLAFGTLKGAFYALLFALPMAVLGAIYTAYFMAPAMRAWVKPGIEIMAALPTVILGFLAGLWLAPLVEANLTAVFSLFVLLPIGMLLMGVLWHVLPERVTRDLGLGWNAALLILPIVAIVALSFAAEPVLEAALFGGDVKSWMRNELGIGYDQRNCLVVGVAMGLAVIPTIFSIAEDAIYSVPRHLINGSLALGATPWQTLTRVVLLTASPGIFSAAMIGMGRAVGETMIVLMSTGNTPVMDFSIFQGMRTFAANIAVELPESAVGSTHYRVLFLAALVLFALTFTVNTAAELVRQRLRAKYGNL